MILLAMSQQTGRPYPTPLKSGQERTRPAVEASPLVLRRIYPGNTTTYLPIYALKYDIQICRERDGGIGDSRVLYEPPYILHTPSILTCIHFSLSLPPDPPPPLRLPFGFSTYIVLREWGEDWGATSVCPGVLVLGAQRYPRSSSSWNGGGQAWRGSRVWKDESITGKTASRQEHTISQQNFTSIVSAISLLVGSCGQPSKIQSPTRDRSRAYVGFSHLYSPEMNVN
ncbi:hypothetical protein ARMGADRAFT_1035548 [Armillaria gallica]|uniref:Uncharacterized protein n=1 Tax=Armillaria gallica TaxID=47427 RepID=A0A2H3D6C3_ARMGA|nr:hypothetical protein ARMGADRAFT_1035548 [Armillaria gallica]